MQLQRVGGAFENTPIEQLRVDLNPEEFATLDTYAGMGAAATVVTGAERPAALDSVRNVLMQAQDAYLSTSQSGDKGPNGECINVETSVTETALLYRLVVGGAMMDLVQQRLSLTEMSVDHLPFTLNRVAQGLNVASACLYLNPNTAQLNMDLYNRYPNSPALSTLSNRPPNRPFLSKAFDGITQVLRFPAIGK